MVCGTSPSDFALDGLQGQDENDHDCRNERDGDGDPETPLGLKSVHRIISRLNNTHPPADFLGQSAADYGPNRISDGNNYREIGNRYQIFSSVRTSTDNSLILASANVE